MAARLNLDAASPCDRAGRRRACAEAFAPFFEAVPTEVDPAPETLALTRHHVGALTLVEMVAPAHTLRRTPDMAARQGLDGLMFLFWLDGQGRVTWPEGESALGRLQGLLIDLTQPVTIVSGPVRATGLVLPRALVADQVPNLADLHGAAFDMASDPVSRLFFTCVQETAETANVLTDDQGQQVTRAVATLCGAALRRRSVGAASQEPRRGIAIRRFIQSELGSPSLSVEAVAERFGLSRAGLYRLFADEGGVQRFIREQRLVRAMTFLARPRGSGRPRVSTVAHTCGFSDEKTFSRAFKRRFGLLPSAVGSAVLPQDAIASAPVPRSEEIAA